MQLIKRPEVTKLYAKPRATLYSEISRGLFVQPVKLSQRSVAWPLNEVEQIISARIAGKSDEEIKRLVVTLETARKAAA